MRYILNLTTICFLTISGFSQSITDSLTSKPDKYGWGLELGPCTGVCYSTGESADFIKNGCFGSVGVTMNYGRLTHMFRLAGISSSIKSDIPNFNEWNQSNDLNSGNFELLTGYKLLKTKRLNFSPYGGVYTSRFNTQVDGDIIDKSDRFFNFTLGTITELKFNLEKKSNPFRPEMLDNEIYYWYIKLYTGYYPNYFKALELDGNELYWNISIGMNIRGYRVTKKTEN